MRIELDIDSYRHSIDSTDPEVLGRWLVEMFARVGAAGWTPATFIRVQCYPSFTGTVEGRSNPDADWIADMSINPAWHVKSPRAVVEGMTRVLDRLGVPK